MTEYQAYLQEREIDHLGQLLAQVENSSDKFRTLDPSYADKCMALVNVYRAHRVIDYRTAYVGVTRLGACLDGWARRVCSHNVVSLQQRMAAQRIAEGC